MSRFVFFFAVSAFVYSCCGQTIYGIKSQSIGSTATGQYLAPATLYKFSDDGTAFTSIAPITDNGTQLRADGLAYSTNDGLWCFGILPDVSSTLYQIDPNTAEVIGEGTVFTEKQIFAATFDRSGFLWAVDQSDDVLLKIDISTGTVLNEVSLTLDGDLYDVTNSSGDICFDAFGQAYMVDHNYIFQLDVYTGALSLLFDDQSGKYLVGAVIPAERPDTLITFDVLLTSIDNDDIFVYDLADLSEPVYLFEAILNSYNAGRGDLAADCGYSNFIDLVDFGAFAGEWKQNLCAADTWCDGQDFDKSGIVDLDDLYFLAANWLEVVR